MLAAILKLFSSLFVFKFFSQFSSISFIFLFLFALPSPLQPHHFSQITISEVAVSPLRPLGSDSPSWLRVYNGMLNDIITWTAVHILSHNDAEVLKIYLIFYSYFEFDCTFAFCNSYFCAFKAVIKNSDIS